MVLHLYKLYVTYIKVNPDTKKIYVGKTSGWVNDTNIEIAQQIVHRRDKYHHKTKDGFVDADLERFSTNSDAIRGREDLLIRAFKAKDISGNIYNGISQRNPKRNKYIAEAIRIFGDIAISYLFFCMA